MNDQTIQLVRTIVQTLWGAVLGLAVVDGWIRQTGLDPEWARGAAVTVTVAVVVFVSQRLPDAGKVWRVIRTLLNGVDRPPAYRPPAG